MLLFIIEAFVGRKSVTTTYIASPQRKIFLWSRFVAAQEVHILHSDGTKQTRLEEPGWMSFAGPRLHVHGQCVGRNGHHLRNFTTLIVTANSMNESGRTMIAPATFCVIMRRKRGRYIRRLRESFNGKLALRHLDAVRDISIALL